MPASKHDTGKAEAVVALGYPAVGSIVRVLLDWLADINWPVARVFAPFLASIGDPLRPTIQGILEDNDDVLKYNILQFVVGKSPELRISLKDDLKRIAETPRPGERKEECDLVAQEILRRYRDPEASVLSGRSLCRRNGNDRLSSI